MSVLSEGLLAQFERLIATKSKLIQHKRNSWKFEGKWLRAGHIHYTSSQVPRLWETTERTTRRDGLVDGADIIATRRSTVDKEVDTLSLVAVYRPPVDKISIEFPAGLVNSGEDPSVAAIRELREETKQDGICQSVSSVVFTDPWKSNENSVVCQISVTGEYLKDDLQLDEDEFLESFQLPLVNLLESLKALQDTFDVVVEAKLYMFALGLHMGSRGYQQ